MPVADTDFMRQAILRFLSDLPETTVIGEAATLPLSSAKTTKLHPDVLLNRKTLAETIGAAKLQDKMELLHAVWQLETCRHSISAELMSYPGTMSRTLFSIWKIEFVFQGDKTWLRAQRIKFGFYSGKYQAVRTILKCFIEPVHCVVVLC